MRKKTFLFFLIFSLSPLYFFAQTAGWEQQDVTGLWKGYMYNDTTQKNYKYEIAISEKKGKLYGYSHTYFIIDDKEYHGVKKVKINKRKDRLIVEDVELIANNYPVAPPRGVHQISALVFELKDTVMMLTGLFTTTTTREYHSVTGYIHIERKRNYWQSALIPHLQELDLVKNLSFVDTKPILAPINTVAVLSPNETIPEGKPAIQQQQIKIETKVQPTTAAIKQEPIVQSPKTGTPVVVAKPVSPTVASSNNKLIPAVPVATTVTAAPPISKPVIATKPVMKPPASVVVNNTPAVITPIKTNPTPPPSVAVSAVEKPVTIIAKANIPVANPPVAFETRKIENIESVYYKSDSLEITLYDNGEVDGDTVSVLMNGKVIMSRVGLSTNAVRKTIYTQGTGDSIQIVMYAETLGSLPPNTGLLIVNDGGERYEIRFSGDLQRSSAIVFRKRK